MRVPQWQTTWANSCPSWQGKQVQRFLGIRLFFVGGRGMAPPQGLTWFFKSGRVVDVCHRNLEIYGICFKTKMTQMTFFFFGGGGMWIIHDNPKSQPSDQSETWKTITITTFTTRNQRDGRLFPHFHGALQLLNGVIHGCSRGDFTLLQGIFLDPYWILRMRALLPGLTCWA